MLDRIKYLDVSKILTQQKDVGERHLVMLIVCWCSSHLQVILAEIRQISQSHIVHPGLDFSKNGFVVGEGRKIDPADVPGLKESGWTPEMDEL